VAVVLIRGLLALVASLAFVSAAPASIVFSSDRNPELWSPHRYRIAAGGGSPTELAAPPAGTPSPDGRLVATAATVDGELDVSVAPAGGAARVVARVPVTTAGAATRIAQQIVWSPDGRRLAFTDYLGCDRFSTVLQIGCGTYELWTVSTDGSGLTLVGRGRRPSWAPDSERLAFTAYYDPFSRDSVFVALADGSGVRALAPGAQPVWSPRGNTIAYNGTRGVTIVDVATRRKRVLGLAAPGIAPVWSPDGTRVAFVGGNALAASRPSAPELLVADARRAVTRVVVRGRVTGATLAFPTWSPDGRRLAFVGSTRTYTASDGTHVHTYAAAPQVLVVGARGGHVAQVTRELPWASFSELAWTSGGRDLVYTVEQVQNDSELYTIAADGTGLRQLTDNLFDDVEPSVAPDGSKILFLRRAASPVAPVESGFYVLDLATGAEQRLPVPLPPNAAGVDPAWSPDGSEFAFVNGVELALARRDGTLVRTFATLGQPSHPSWSPDGSRIAFSDRAPGAANAIFTVGRDGGGLAQVTSFEFAREPSWSPDGRWIAFFGDPGNGPSGLWVVHPDGTGVRLVTTLRGLNAGAPAWSPDSTHLLYAVSFYGGPPIGTLHEIGLDGSDDTVLDSAVGTTRDPVWQG
jgi:Tol biopolymer transport system component